MKKPEMEKYPVCLYRCPRDCLSLISEKLTNRIRAAMPKTLTAVLMIHDEALEEWRLVYEKA